MEVLLINIISFNLHNLVKGININALTNRRGNSWPKKLHRVAQDIAGSLGADPPKTKQHKAYNSRSY